MIIDIVKTNKEFLSKYKNILDEYELQTQLIRINLNESDEILSKDAFRGAILDNDKIVLLFLNANPFNLQIFSLIKSNEANKLLSDYIVTNNIDICGVQALEDNYYLFINNCSFKDKLKIVMKMNVMEIKKLKEMEVFGSIQKIQESDKELIKKYYKGFVKDCFGSIASDESCEDFAIRNYERGKTYLYTNKNGIKTSSVSIARIINKYCCISFVYTDEMYRNKGYGKEMIYLITKKILEDDYYSSLYVDMSNPISNKVYLSVGYKYMYNVIDSIFEK